MSHYCEGEKLINFKCDLTSMTLHRMSLRRKFFSVYGRKYHNTMVENIPVLRKSLSQQKKNLNKYGSTQL